MNFRFVRRGCGFFFLALACVLASGLTEVHAETGEPRIRLREHFDVSRIRWGDGGIKESYFGATNTANLFWEVSHHYAIGLAFNPILSSGYGQVGKENVLVDDRVDHLFFGIEGKYHVFHDSVDYEWANGAFVRAGVFASYLKVNDRFGGDRWGAGYYFGLGWEFMLFDGWLGVSPDVGFRHTILERDTQIVSFTPSISVSFYGLSDWIFGGSESATENMGNE